MKKIITGFTLSIALSAGSANAAMIDDFNGDVFNSTSAPLTNAAAGNSSVGYARTITATSSGISTDIAINTPTNPGVYAHSQSSGVTGYSQIDFALGGIDLTSGANAFSVTLASADLGGVFGVIADGVSVSLTTNTVLLSSGLTFPGVAEFLFSDFAGVDFTSVNTVSLFIDGTGTAALDMSIDSFGTTCSALNATGGAGKDGTIGNCSTDTSNVPEPAPLALLSMGLVAFGFGRRKFS